MLPAQPRRFESHHDVFAAFHRGELSKGLALAHLVDLPPYLSLDDWQDSGLFEDNRHWDFQIVERVTLLGGPWDGCREEVWGGQNRIHTSRDQSGSFHIYARDEHEPLVFRFVRTCKPRR